MLLVLVHVKVVGQSREVVVQQYKKIYQLVSEITILRNMLVDLGLINHHLEI